MISQLERAVCPIFTEKPYSGATEHIGSAVLIEIEGKLFLLTAAHITDRQEMETLLVPGVDGLISPHGYFAHVSVSKGKTRDNDRMDIAYYRLDDDIRSELDPKLKPMHREDMALFESLMQGDIYSFSGFPHRKTRIHGDTVETELFSYTGCVVDDETYRELGYDPGVHIVVKFDRKQSYLRYGPRNIPPLPHGVSGGGIFAWRKDFVDGGDPDDRRLVGIAHSYHKHNAHHYLAGTRINAFLSCILRNNPALIQETESSALPMLTGVAWYRCDEWDRLKREFDDGAQLQSTWHQWRCAAERGIDYLAARGHIVSPVELSADEIHAFCVLKKLPNVSSTRVELVNEKLFALSQESDF